MGSNVLPRRICVRRGMAGKQKAWKRVAQARSVLNITIFLFLICVQYIACGNRYEGLWKSDMKNGSGRFMYLNKGQVYTGEWVDDVPVCGMLEDVGRNGAPDPPVYPIPKV